MKIKTTEMKVDSIVTILNDQSIDHFVEWVEEENGWRFGFTKEVWENSELNVEDLFEVHGMSDGLQMNSPDDEDELFLAEYYIFDGQYDGTLKWVGE